MLNKLVTFLLRLHPKHRQQLKITAAKENTSVQKLIEEALKNYEKTKFRNTVEKQK